MANRILEIALMLTAVDQMSNVAKKATDNVDGAFKKIKSGYSDVMKGMAEVYAGKMIVDNTIAPIETAFKRVQDAQIELKKTMTQDGGLYDVNMFSALSAAAFENSNKLGLAQDGITQLQDKLIARGIEANDVLRNLTQPFSEFSAIMNAEPQQSGSFGSALLADWKLTSKELPAVLDLIEKAHHRGLGGNGPDAIEKIQESMRDAALAYTATNVTGAQAAKDYLIMSMAFLNRNLESATIGTSFRKLQDLIHEKEKVDKANEVLQKYKPGYAMRFDDEKGNPLDVKNMLKQFDLLKDMSAQARNEVLQPLTGGKNGIMGDVLKIVAFGGTDAYNEGAKILMGAGNHTAFLREEMEKLSRQQAISDANWNNAKVIMGQQLLPILIKMAHVMAHVAHAVGTFAKNHPIITRLVFALAGLLALVITIGGVLMIAGGAWKVLGGTFLAMIARGSALRAVFEIFIPLLYELSAALLTTPVGWVILGIIAIIALFKNWGGITDWLGHKFHTIFALFKIGWEVVKHVTKAFFNWLWNIFLHYNLFGIIFNNWSAITGFVKNLWHTVKGHFLDFMGWILGLGPRMFHAGANIIGSIWNGIKSMINKPIDAIKGMVQKIRNMLPFSPAKEGPLRDIHKIRLIETIAEGMKPNAMIEKMRSVAGAVLNYSAQGVSAPGSPNPIAGGGVHITFAPVYQAKAGDGYAANRDAFMQDAKKNAKDLVRLIEDQQNRSFMKSFN